MSSQYFVLHVQPEDPQGAERLRQFAKLSEQKDYDGIAKLDTEDIFVGDEIEHNFGSGIDIETNQDPIILGFDTFCSLDPECVACFVMNLGVTKLEGTVFNSQCCEYGFLFDDEYTEDFDEYEWAWIQNPDIDWEEAFVVITGTLEGGTRAEMAEQIEELGATIQSTINGKTTHLIAGAKPGAAKMRKAEEMGVRILTEEALEDFI